MSHLTLALFLFLAGCSKRADVPPDAAPPAPSPSRAQARTAATAPDAAPARSAAGDPGSAAPGVLGVDDARAKLKKDPASMVGTQLTLRGRVQSCEGEAGYGMILLTDAMKPPAPNSKATWLCRGIYAEEQTLAATGAIVTVRGRVGKDPAYPLLENCDVVK